MAAILGAPVTEPPGNIAASSSGRPASARTRPVTLDTRCSTPAIDRGVMSSGHATLPGSQTRPRSLRSRSTIITCSAASLSDARNSAAPPRAGCP